MKPTVTIGAAVALALASHAHAFNILPACSIAAGQGVTCVAGMTQNPQHAWNLYLTPNHEPVGMPAIGTTVATVHENFPAVMVWDFTTLTAAQLNTQFDLIDAISLARFSHAYYLATGGNTAPLVALAKAKLSATNFAIFEKAFNPASAQLIPESAAAHVKAGAVYPTMNGLTGGVAAPTVNMTLSEVYTEYLFTSAETTLGAVMMAARFAVVELQTAGVLGYQIGTAWYAFATYVDPDYGVDLIDLYGPGDDFGAPGGGVTVTVGPITCNDCGGGSDPSPPDPDSLAVNGWSW
jgi:hypothetical protein